MYKYVSDFFSRNMFFMTVLKIFVSYFYNHNKNLYNKFVFLKKLMYFSFLKLC